MRICAQVRTGDAFVLPRTGCAMCNHLVVCRHRDSRLYPPYHTRGSFRAERIPIFESSGGGGGVKYL